MAILVLFFVISTKVEKSLNLFQKSAFGGYLRQAERSLDFARDDKLKSFWLGGLVNGEI